MNIKYPHSVSVHIDDVDRLFDGARQIDRDAYIAAVKQELINLGHSEELAAGAACGLYLIARKHPEDVNPERDAREWDIGYDAGRDA